MLGNYHGGWLEELASGSISRFNLRGVSHAFQASRCDPCGRLHGICCPLHGSFGRARLHDLRKYPGIHQESRRYGSSRPVAADQRHFLAQLAERAATSKSGEVATYQGYCPISQVDHAGCVQQSVLADDAEREIALELS